MAKKQIDQMKRYNKRGEMYNSFSYKITTSRFMKLKSKYKNRHFRVFTKQGKQGNQEDSSRYSLFSNGSALS